MSTQCGGPDVSSECYRRWRAGQATSDMKKRARPDVSHGNSQETVLSSRAVKRAIGSRCRLVNITCEGRSQPLAVLTLVNGPRVDCDAPTNDVVAVVALCSCGEIARAVNRGFSLGTAVVRRDVRSETRRVPVTQEIRRTAFRSHRLSVDPRAIRRSVRRVSASRRCGIVAIGRTATTEGENRRCDNRFGARETNLHGGVIPQVR